MTGDTTGSHVTVPVSCWALTTAGWPRSLPSQAISIGNALQDAGEAEIVAVGHTNGFVEGIGGVSALMEFYGLSRALPSVTMEAVE